jgi:hypothetical protein
MRPTCLTTHLLALVLLGVGVTALPLEVLAQHGQGRGQHGQEQRPQKQREGHQRQERPQWQERSGRAAEPQQRLSPREAAARAQARHGGKVLQVSPRGDSYRVKLLQSSGRVVTVTVED